MPRYVPFAAGAALLAILAVFHLGGSSSPPDAPPPPSPPPTAQVPPLVPADEEPPPEPGSFLDRARSSVPRSNPPRPTDTVVRHGISPGTVILNAQVRGRDGDVPATIDPVDAWRRPLHEVRQLFTSMPSLLGAELALHHRGARVATLRLPRETYDAMKLQDALERMHEERRKLLEQQQAGKLDAAALDTAVRELERRTFAEVLANLPEEAKTIDAELRP